ncbi:MAG: alpha/beta hydrolase, partial [Cyanobacteria bacterium P01_A01_bin.17]
TFVENFLQSKNGEFLFLQLDKAISSSSGRTEADLEALKSAVLESIDDRQVSFLEIIDRHPMDTIRVDLTNLEGTYNDVSGFVERVLPALEVAKGVLQDIVCDCDSAQSASSAQPVNTQPVNDGARSYGDASHANCNKATTLTKAVPLPEETAPLTKETFQSLLKSLDKPVDQ